MAIVIMFWLYSILLIDFTVDGLENGLGRTPIMGWMAWTRFMCEIDCIKHPRDCISEHLFRQMADRLSEDGYLAAGYQYLTIDDCWMAKKRDSNGFLMPDPIRFPSGMKALVDYVHKKGLKFGIYLTYGKYTCMRYPGSIAHLEQDIKMIVDWNVDFLKLDGCYAPTEMMPGAYAHVAKLLNETAARGGPKIFFLCSYPFYIYRERKTLDPQHLINTCNTWRMYDDIQDSWESVSDIIDWFGLDVYKQSTWAAPGHFNDADMLDIGNFGLTEAQERTQMAIWSILASPLLMSNDLRDLRSSSRSVLLNQQLIAIDQDPMGRAGKRIALRDGGALQVWARRLTPADPSVAAPSFALVFFNAHPKRSLQLAVSLGELKSALMKLDVDLNIAAAAGANLHYSLVEAFENKPLGHFSLQTRLRATIAPNDVLIVTAHASSGAVEELHAEFGDDSHEKELAARRDPEQIEAERVQWGEPQELHKSSGYGSLLGLFYLAIIFGLGLLFRGPLMRIMHALYWFTARKVASKL